MDKLSGVIYFEGWSLDCTKYELIGSTRKRITLTDQEFLVLQAFIQHPEQLLKDVDLQKLAWNREIGEHSPRKYVGLVRKKFKKAGIDSKTIKNRRGVGYIFYGKPKQSPEVGQQGFPSADETPSGLGQQVLSGLIEAFKAIHARQVLFLCAAILICIGTLFLASRAYPYSGFRTTVVPSELEQRVRGIVAVFARDVLVDNCTETYNSKQTDWQIGELVRVKGLSYTRNMLEGRGAWFVECETQGTEGLQGVFDTSGNLESLKLPSAPAGIGPPIDYGSNAERATEIARGVFDTRVEGRQPTPFLYDGHDYRLGDRHLDPRDGAPFEWPSYDPKHGEITLQLKLNYEGRLLSAEVVPKRSDIERDLHYIYNSYFGPPKFQRVLWFLCTGILVVIVFVQLIRFRKALIRRNQLLLFGAVSLFLLVCAVPDVFNQFNDLFADVEFDSAADLATTKVVFAIGYVVSGIVPLLLTALVARLYARVWSASSLFPTLRSTRSRIELSRQIFKGLMWAGVYLLAHCAVLLALEKARLGSWTSLWIVNGTLQGDVWDATATPIVLAAKSIFLIVILFSTFHGLRARWPWVGMAGPVLFLVAGQYTVPNAFGNFMPSAGMTAIFSLLQAVALTFVAWKGEMAQLGSFVLGVSTFLLVYPVFTIFWKSTAWTLLCFSGVILTVCIAVILYASSHLIRESASSATA